MCCAGDAADALALFSTVQGDANLLQVQPRMLLLNTLRAQSLRALGELETALPHYDVCLTLAASLQDTAAEKTAAESKTKVFDMLHLQQQGAANQFKAQGDAAFKEKKVALAISHYTSALLLDPKLIAAYSNRAMCYSILGQNAAAIVGYHFAIFLLQADDEESVKKTAKFLARRGAVYWAHSMHDQARTDLKNALDLLDEQSALRPKLEADLAVLVLSIRFRNVTKKAQRAFKQDDMDDAIRLYTKGLQLYSDKISKQKGQQIDVTVMASLLSNRAACQLQAGLYALCAKDCLRSLNLLEHAPAETAEVKDRVSSIKIATSIRLGTAQAEVGKLDEAIDLYETSLAQAPSSHFSEEERAAMLADLKMLKAQNN
jgi:tetratricopeptide (TPR) repeat protein